MEGDRWLLYCALKMLREFTDLDNIYDPIGGAVGRIDETIERLEETNED